VKSTPLPPIHQGDDYTAIANITHNGGLALPLAGFSAPAAQLRRDTADIDTTIDATFTCTISGPSSITLFLPKTVTITLSGCYRYDLEVFDGTGHLVTIARGPAPVDPEVTRP
jgi:hypothetical protein